MTLDLSSLRGRQITVVEVGPRDGLQNERIPVSTRDKITFVDRLSSAGLPVIEVTAFVGRRRVPQMADAAEVFAGISRKSGTRYTALVPNLEGLDRALEANVSEAAVFAAASETFSRKNINQSVAASLETYRAVCDRALSARRRIRAYVSTAFGCPYEGPVAPATVVALSRRLLDLGASEVAISDTIGVAHPAQVASVLDAVLEEIPVEQVALHFHDTRGMALANVLAALGHGVLTFDASAGGLGGCPFAPGATGNLATEDLVYMLDGLGAVTGVSLGALSAASGFIASRVDHPLASRYAQAASASGHALGGSSG